LFFLCAVSAPSNPSQLQAISPQHKFTPLGPGRHVFKRMRSYVSADENAVYDDKTASGYSNFKSKGVCLSIR